MSDFTIRISNLPEESCYSPGTPELRDMMLKALLIDHFQQLIKVELYDQELHVVHDFDEAKRIGLQRSEPFAWDIVDVCFAKEELK